MKRARWKRIDFGWEKKSTFGARLTTHSTPLHDRKGSQRVIISVPPMIIDCAWTSDRMAKEAALIAVSRFRKSLNAALDELEKK